ncbi:17984_t:CDS:2 [Entrophospora sp. SA101]|nr:17984_t:CDS:2 [Entrophospora sp. SA101]
MHPVLKIGVVVEFAGRELIDIVEGVLDDVIGDEIEIEFDEEL